MGHLRRKHGLSIDNLISADVVTADGQLRRASASENADLYWAIRGAGSNFGVVTSFEFAAHPVGPMVYAGALFYPLEQAREILATWRDFMADGARRGLVARHRLERPRRPAVPRGASTARTRS